MNLNLKHVPKICARYLRSRTNFRTQKTLEPNLEKRSSPTQPTSDSNERINELMICIFINNKYAIFISIKFNIKRHMFDEINNIYERNQR